MKALIIAAVATVAIAGAAADSSDIKYMTYGNAWCTGSYNTTTLKSFECLKDHVHNKSWRFSCGHVADRLAVTFDVYGDNMCGMKTARTAAECGSCMEDDNKKGTFYTIDKCDIKKQSFNLRRLCSDSSCRKCKEDLWLNTSVCTKSIDNANMSYNARMVIKSPDFVREVQYSNAECKGLGIVIDLAASQCLSGGMFTCPARPTPNGTTTMAPPPIPTPSTTAAPSSGTLVQLACQDSMCSQSCDKGVFPLGQCLPMSAGSAVATCRGGFVHLKIFSNSTMCTGMATDSKMPTDQCLPSSAGGYLENFCLTHSVKPQAQAVLHRSI